MWRMFGSRPLDRSIPIAAAALTTAGSKPAGNAAVLLTAAGAVLLTAAGAA